MMRSTLAVAVALSCFCTCGEDEPPRKIIDSLGLNEGVQFHGPEWVSDPAEADLWFAEKRDDIGGLFMPAEGKKLADLGLVELEDALPPAPVEWTLTEVEPEEGHVYACQALSLIADQEPWDSSIPTVVFKVWEYMYDDVTIEYRVVE